MHVLLFFFLFPNWSYWHYLLFCAKIIGMEISLLPLLGCQSWCNWKTRFPALRSHVWGIGAQKHLSSLRALYGFFSLFSFSSLEHSTRNFLRVGQKLMCLCQQNPSSQKKQSQSELWEHSNEESLVPFTTTCLAPRYSIYSTKIWKWVNACENN